MLFEVIMYSNNDKEIAKSLVEADTANQAHAVAIRLMRKQYPNVDPQLCNQTIASEIFFRSSND